jgi:hypothetical protein
MFSGMYRHAVLWKSTEVSDEHIDSIIRAKYEAGKKQSCITEKKEFS